jgi:hypothetical protein
MRAGCTISWLTIIAGMLSIYGGSLGLMNDPLGVGRTWILYIYQVLFGVILMGNEVPIHAINRQFPGLQTYDGKGLFLVFISTFMYGATKPMSSGSDGEWKGWLADLCALALFIKGVCCLGLAMCGSRCPLCCMANAHSTVTGV